MKIFDTHAHYNDKRFDANRDALIEEVLRSQVERIVNVGTNPDSSLESIALAERYEAFYAAAGVHPSDANLVCERERETLDQLRGMLAHPKVRAIGEIGLDYHYDFTDRETQRRWFHLQLELAEETGYPVIIHDRDAHGDCMEILGSHRNVRGILHSFSGSPEMARQLSDRGWYISFSGVVTFKNAARVLDSVRAVPDELLLVETDCPYLAPVPMRGRDNRSDYLPYTIAAVAAARGSDSETIAALTYRNACAVYRLPENE